MTDGGMSVAIAGGTGAFLGATVGQMVQWLRDRQHEERVDERERRTRRHDHYLEVLAYLQQLLAVLQQTTFAAVIWADVGADSGREACLHHWREVGFLAKEPLAQATARVQMVGSPEARHLIRSLGRSLMTFDHEPSAVIMDEGLPTGISELVGRIDGEVEALQDQIRNELDLAE